MQKLKLFRLLFIALLVLFKSDIIAAVDSPANAWGDVSFYLSFEEGLQADVAEGYAVAKGPHSESVVGKVGDALSLPKGNALSVSSMGNFTTKQGGVSFWMRLDQPLNEVGAESVNSILFAANGIQLCVGKEGKLWLMTGGLVDGRDFRWDYSVFSDASRFFKVGKWYHISAFWDAKAQHKTLLINGKKMGDGPTGIMPDREMKEGKWVQFGKRTAAISFDEVVIWKDMPSPEVIHLLAEEPNEAARQITTNRVGETDAVIPRISLGFHKDSPASNVIVDPGEPYTLFVPVTNDSDQVQEFELILTLINFWDEALSQQRVPLKLEPRESRQVSVDFVSKASGIYKVRAKIQLSNIKVLQDVGGFAIWPTPTETPAKDSFFGGHINSFSKEMPDMAKRLGMGWNRNHNMLQSTWWPRTQPEPGEPTWIADNQMDLQKSHGFQVLGQFFGTPYWASAGIQRPPPKSATSYPYSDVPKMDAFEKYVFDTVTHYKDYIHYWETWNEADVSMFWHGSPEDYAELCKVAYRAAKAADPDCFIFVGGLGSSGWGWHNQAAKAGAFKYADGISFHFGTPLRPPEETYLELEAVVEHFRTIAVNSGKSRDITLWDTEGGIPSTTWYAGLDFPGLPSEDIRTPNNAQEAAIRIVQGSAIHQMLGVDKHFYYLHNFAPLDERAFNNTLMLELTNAPKPAFMARIVMASELGGAIYDSAIRREEGRFWACLYQQPNSDEVTVLCWAGDQGELEFIDAAFDGLPYSDLMGNRKVNQGAFSLGDEPVYLHFKQPLMAVKALLESMSIRVLREPTELALADVADRPDIPKLPNYVAVKEMPGKDFFVDLKPFANRDLADELPGDGVGGWSDEGNLNDARELTVGTQEFYGVPFQIIDPAANGDQSVLVLRSKESGQQLPQAIEGIPLGGVRLRALYFLHTVAWGRSGDAAFYRINYVDGETVEVKVSIPYNVNNWWNGWDDSEVSRPVPFKVSNTISGKPEWRYLRAFEWENKREVAIASIDFVSTDSGQTPILLAITALR